MGEVKCTRSSLSPKQKTEANLKHTTWQRHPLYITLRCFTLHYVALGKEFFIIKMGEVKCTRAGAEEEISRRLTTGDFFGELALMSSDTRQVIS